LKIIGVICEYNPLHLGHKKQLDLIRQRFGQDCGIVCLMSGNFVQRGMPAVFDKSLRAEAALYSGADLVLELPVTYALSSAEGFAEGGVAILGDFCHGLCFGAETENGEQLLETAKVLLSDEFRIPLRQELESGKSFPAARQAALEKLGLDGQVLTSPNNILAVEYCKAILARKSSMKPLPILREGSYHDESPDPENPSATAVRKLIGENGEWHCYVPAEAAKLFENAPVHTLRAGETSIRGRLRTMRDDEFEALPYGSEGLWRKFMAACRREATVEEIQLAVKSKRYTRTRLDRMLMCAFLGISREMLEQPAPYARVLAMNERGRGILKQAKKTGQFLNAGEKSEDSYWLLEQRCGDLYGLFCETGPEKPGREQKRRMIYVGK
jgi:predicted nucleotidyltransferase